MCGLYVFCLLLISIKHSIQQKKLHTVWTFMGHNFATMVRFARQLLNNHDIINENDIFRNLITYIVI